MNLTQGQEDALKAVESLNKAHPNGGGILIINGPAGTGKSTLIKTIADQAGDPLVLAPTGKAALRVRDVAFCRTSTIHKWMYIPDEDPETGEVFYRNKSLLEVDSPGFHSIIVDEASMVSRELWNDLYKYAVGLGVNVILIGDEFQLPPVASADDKFSVFDKDFKYDIKVSLTEVLRQALDNPILKVATAVRIGNDYTLELSKLPIIEKSKLLDGCVDTYSADGVIICHTNETRFNFNNDIRKSLGRILGIESKEPVLVIRNNYQLDIFNGEVFAIKNVIGSIGLKTVKDKFKNKSCYMDFIRVQLQNGDECILSQEQLSNKTNEIDFKFINKQSNILSKQIAKREGLDKSNIPYLHANYGYVMTCNKAQGSEWDNVLTIIEPTIKITTLSGRRWLYTSLTRSKKNIKLCWYQ
jgi:exodeoxyribonuclease-5